MVGGATDNIAQASNKVFALRGGKLGGVAESQARAGGAGGGGGGRQARGRSAGRTTSRSSRRPRCSTATRGATRVTCRPRASTWLRCRTARYVYAVGGRFLSADKNSAAFDRFDPRSGTWETLVDMPTPRGSYGATYIDGRIVAVGGEDPTQVLGCCRDVRHRRGEMDQAGAVADRRVTPRWSLRWATPCTSSVARTGPRMRGPSRRSRRLDFT